MIEFGGGIWIYELVICYFELGIDCLILGLVVLIDLWLVKWLLSEFGGEWIVIGLDGINGYVVIKGWLE